MSVDRDDPIDRVIDEALASMVEGEPRRVNAASVRLAMGESRTSRLPMWLAIAAMLLVAVGLRFRNDTPPPSPLVVRSTPEPVRVEAGPAPAPGPGSSKQTASAIQATVATTTEPRYEGLPRLDVAFIELPESLSPRRLDADPLDVPLIEIAPLSVSSLDSHQEN